MSRGIRFPILPLALAVLASSSAPALSVRSLIPCMDPTDCAAMRDLCDMTSMTSHDSCCQVSNAGDAPTLPATLKSSAGTAHPLSMIRSVAPAALPALAAGVTFAPLPELSGRSSPASITVLRI